jgi:hypothetical protein
MCASLRSKKAALPSAGNTQQGNRLENYYPGPEIVDWLGVSIYGAQEPKSEECLPFESQMQAAYSRLNALAPEKPIFVLEMGATRTGSDAPSSSRMTLPALLWEGLPGGRTRRSGKSARTLSGSSYVASPGGTSNGTTPR